MSTAAAEALGAGAAAGVGMVALAVSDTVAVASLGTIGTMITVAGSVWVAVRTKGSEDARRTMDDYADMVELLQSDNRLLREERERDRQKILELEEHIDKQDRELAVITKRLDALRRDPT